jgi:quinol monooxygenase YgiN
MTAIRKLALGAVMAAGALASAQSALAQIKIEPSTNGEVSIMVDFDVKPGKEAEFEKVFQRSVMCARLEPGNITFNVHKVMDVKDHYVLYEQWRSETALNSHFERPYTKALFAMFDRNLTVPITQGGLRWVSDMAPAPRRAPVTTDPANTPACR